MIKPRYRQLYWLFLQKCGQVIEKGWNTHEQPIYIIDTKLFLYKVLIATHEQLALIAAYRGKYTTDAWAQCGLWDRNLNIVTKINPMRGA
jgi:hypothetical protein